MIMGIYKLNLCFDKCVKPSLNFKFTLLDDFSHEFSIFKV